MKVYSAPFGSVFRRNIRPILESGFVGVFVAVFAVLLPLFDFNLTHPIAGVSVPVGILFGFYGAVAVAVGYIIGKLAVGSFYVGSLSVAFAYSVVGCVSAVVWNEFRNVDRNQSLPKRGLAHAGRFLGTIAVAALSGGVVLAWGYEILGLFPFYLASRYVFSFGLASLLIAPPVLLVAAFVSDRATASDTERAAGREMTRPLWVTVAVMLVWLLVGTIGSIGYRAVDVLLSQYPRVFTTRDLEILLIFHGDSFYGPGGRRAQAAFGGVMFLFLVLVLARLRGVLNGWRIDVEGRDEQ